MFDFLLRRDIAFGAQPCHYLSQLLVQRGECVVAERDAYRDLAVERLGNFAARPREPRQRRERGRLEKTEIDAWPL